MTRCARRSPAPHPPHGRVTRRVGRRHGLEHLLARGPVHVVLWRGTEQLLRVPCPGAGGSIGCGRRVPDCDQPIVFFKWQAAQDHGIDHGEDRGAGTDAPGEDDGATAVKAAEAQEAPKGGDPNLRAWAVRPPKVPGKSVPAFFLNNGGVMEDTEVPSP